jgi:hypothetical protein
MRLTLTARRFLVTLPLFIFIGISLSPAGQRKDTPPSWTVGITLDVRGDYKMDARGIKIDGTFAFIFRWTGTIEKDAEDYLLVHNDCRLTNWEIEEKSDSAGSLKTLSTEEIPEKPALKVNYILKSGKNLVFDFAVEGFEIPKSKAPAGFYLVLPASKENLAHFGGIGYDLFVKSGSNMIVMDENPILRGPSEKTFAWTWKYQTGIQTLGGTAFQSQTHEVKAKIEITPRKDVR